jgi:hypothetical protein
VLAAMLGAADELNTSRDGAADTGCPDAIAEFQCREPHRVARRTTMKWYDELAADSNRYLKREETSVPETDY